MLDNRFSKVCEPIAEVIQSFGSEGYEIFLVGGVVRDVLLGASASHDIDLTTNARPEHIKRLLTPYVSALWSQGERFGTIGGIVNDQNIEITTFRAESYDETTRKPHVQFGNSLEADLARRDFTINAIAVALPNGKLIDPFSGSVDLSKKVLRTPTSSEVSFSDDPLRMFRAARFLARFSLTAAEDIVDTAKKMCDRVGVVSVERIRTEFDRLLEVEDPSVGLEFLFSTGLFQAAIIKQQMFAFNSQKWGTFQQQALSFMLEENSLFVRRCGLFWFLGADVAHHVLTSLKYSSIEIKESMKLLVAVDETFDLQACPASVRRVIDSVGMERVADLRSLANTLAASVAKDPSLFFEILDDLVKNEDLQDLGSPLSGSEIMSYLDIPGGPLVGEGLKMLREHRISNGPFSKEKAFSLLDMWKKSK